MNTTQTQVRSTDEALSVFDTLKLALEALSPWSGENANHTEQYAAYYAIDKALAQPAVAEQHKQEPVARLHITETDDYPDIEVEVLNGASLQPSMSPVNVYTTPPKPKEPEQTLKLMPREATPEMLKAMDECSTEGYDERLYEGHAGSVYMAAWDAFHGQHCYCGDITNLGVIHRDDGPCHYSEHTSEYKRGYADAMNWKMQNHLEHLPAAQPKQEPVAFLVYAKGSRRYFTLTFDVEKVPEIYKGGEAVPLYTTPPQRTWVGLTESDRRLINFQWQDGNGTATDIIDLVEAKLKEKNT